MNNSRREILKAGLAAAVLPVLPALPAVAAVAPAARTVNGCPFDCGPGVKLIRVTVTGCGASDGEYTAIADNLRFRLWDVNALYARQTRPAISPAPAS